jgi:hypothetical protein
MEIPRVTQNEIESSLKENIRDWQPGPNGNAQDPFMIENASPSRKYEPHRLYRLADMIQFIGDDFLGVMRDIQREIQRFDGRSHESIATTEERKRLEDLLDGDAAKLCQQLNLSVSEDRCCVLANKVLTSPVMVDLPCNELKIGLIDLADSISREVAYTHFAYISEDKIEFFEQNALFGEPFHKNASEEINAEIKAAGNCLAADLHTAAVFHLMRVAEHGLHALANDIGAWNNKPHPIAFSEWHKVIEAIVAKLRELLLDKTANVGRGTQKELDSEYYNGLIDSLNYFKDAYRNPVSHLRGNYNQHGALDVYLKVHDFMQRLATRVPLA